eukprot:gene33996-66601_t
MCAHGTDNRRSHHCVPSYMGVIANRPVIPASALVTIPAGGERTATHDLRTSYAFHTEGEYTLQAAHYFAEVTEQQRAAASAGRLRKGDLKLGEGPGKGGWIETAEVPQPPPSTPAGTVHKVGFKSCSKSQEAMIQTAMQNMEAMVDRSVDVLDSGSFDAFEPWFGPNVGQRRYCKVRDNFHKIKEVTDAEDYGF